MDKHGGAMHQVSFADTDPDPFNAPRTGAMGLSPPPELDHALARRAVAFLIDSMIWIVVIGGLLVTVGRTTTPVLDVTAGGLVLSEQMTFHLSLLQMWGVTCLWFAYVIISEWRAGATLGKKMAGIRVVRSDGTPLGIKTAVLRQAPRFAAVSVLSLFSLYLIVPFVFLVEALTSWSDAYGRRIGERTADTLVLKKHHVPLLAGHASNAGITLPRHATLLPLQGQPAGGVHRTYAGFWRRVAASLVDVLVLLALTELLSAMTLTRSIFDQSGAASGVTLEPTLTSSDGIISSVLNLGYFIYLNGRGATLGKLLVGIRVVDAAGRPPGIRKATVRYIIPALSLLMPFAVEILWWEGSDDIGIEGTLTPFLIFLMVILGYFLFSLYDNLSMLWSDHRQTIHDRMAGTFVVTRERPGHATPASVMGHERS